LRCARSISAITGARQRLSGGFERASEYQDTRGALAQMVNDLPTIENKLADARYTLTDCKAFLDGLPYDVELVSVKSVKPNGYDLTEVRRSDPLLPFRNQFWCSAEEFPARPVC
jgi:hypothetical protein